MAPTGPSVLTAYRRWHGPFSQLGPLRLYGLCLMSNQKLTPLQESEAKRRAAAAAKVNKQPRIFSEAERATRKELVGKAKDALARSVGAKGDHVIAGRAALKKYLHKMNEPNQPDDERFEMLIEAPFKAPPKKRDNDR